MMNSTGGSNDSPARNEDQFEVHRLSIGYSFKNRYRITLILQVEVGPASSMRV